MHFIEWKCINYNLDITKGPINNNPIIGSDNGLAPARRQAIMWANDS